ncbi:MAG: hypothetical protein R3321_13355 [Nitrososphaeraceae archaeon]|nr:hypothetical protein [Nitrososphaeraceae archaeon]
MKIKSIHRLLTFSECIYQRYLETQGSYRYAKILREINYKIEQEILQSITDFEVDDLESIFELLEHLQVWRMEWDHLNENESFKLDDSFKFSTIIPFPKKVNDVLRKYEI